MNTPTIRSYELLHACGSHTHAYHEMLMVKAHLSLSGLLVFSGVIFATWAPSIWMHDGSVMEGKSNMYQGIIGLQVWEVASHECSLRRKLNTDMLTYTIRLLWQWWFPSINHACRGLVSTELASDVVERRSCDFNCIFLANAIESFEPFIGSTHPTAALWVETTEGICSDPVEAEALPTKVSSSCTCWSWRFSFVVLKLRPRQACMHVLETHGHHHHAWSTDHCCSQESLSDKLQLVELEVSASDSESGPNKANGPRPPKSHVLNTQSWQRKIGKCIDLPDFRTSWSMRPPQDEWKLYHLCMIKSCMMSIANKPLGYARECVHQSHRNFCVHLRPRASQSKSDHACCAPCMTTATMHDYCNHAWLLKHCVTVATYIHPSRQCQRKKLRCSLLKHREWGAKSTVFDGHTYDRGILLHITWPGIASLHMHDLNIIICFAS